MPVKKPNFSKKNLLALLEETRKPLRSKDIFGAFQADASLKKFIKAMLASLVSDGTLIQAGKSYALPDMLPKIAGILDVRRSGVGYLIPENRKLKDIFIHPSNFGGAWPGDKVLVITHEHKKGSPEGRVVEVVERDKRELMVRVQRKTGPNTFFCHPTDSRMPFYALVDTEGLQAPERGDILVVEPLAEEDKGLWRCKASRCLGGERDLATQELLVKTGYSIPEEFPVAVLRQAEMLPAEPTEKDWAGRADLRSMQLVTIDGETAKDFDDAVSVEPTASGFRLVVAIADVSHYVPEDSALDQEALSRSNSYYFPLSVEPMFPEALSNGLCSLRPNVPRLAMIVDTHFDQNGESGKTSLYAGVIQSAARLTYTQVQAAFDGSADLQITPLMPMLNNAKALAEILMTKRTSRGCLDFEIPEAQVRMHDREITVSAGVRLFAHRLIEEFMIAANERVAEYLGARERVFPYRIHPQPDDRKLENLLKVLAHTSLVDRLPKEADQAGLQQLSFAVRGTELEYMGSRLILRTMMQAQYSPDNNGHYGLASSAYCHFTSPIRRYADLLVHRSLRRLLRGENESMDGDQLQQICESMNACERKAMEAEREIQKRAAILALEKRVGETMRGVISGVAEFGFWVELLEMPVDGMVRIASLDDDFYSFDPERQELIGQRTGRSFSMGQATEVVLEDLSLERVEITFRVPYLPTQKPSKTRSRRS